MFLNDFLIIFFKQAFLIWQAELNLTVFCISPTKGCGAVLSWLQLKIVQIHLT